MNSIDKNLKTPLYLQLVNILVEKIEKNIIVVLHDE